MDDKLAAIRERIACAVTSAAADGRTVEDPYKVADAVIEELGLELRWRTHWRLYNEETNSIRMSFDSSQCFDRKEAAERMAHYRAPGYSVVERRQTWLETRPEWETVPENDEGRARASE